MATGKRDSLKQPPPPKLAEEEEEDEEESEDEEEGVEEDEEEESGDSDVEQKKEPKAPQNQNQNQNQTSQVNKKRAIVEKPTIRSPQPQHPSGSSDESSEESEDGGPEEDELEQFSHSPSASDFTIKAISPKKPTSKESKPTSKRASETPKIDEKELRIKKKVKVNAEAEKPKYTPGGLGAGRVWSEEDVIRVLNGLIDYRREKGADPSADMGAFHNFVKGKLQAEVTRTQLYEKVRSLRIKHSKNVEKSKVGKLVFEKPHEATCFDISKRIWGDGVITDNVDKKLVVNANGKSDGGKVKKGGKVVNLVGSAKDERIEKKNVAKEKIDKKDVEREEEEAEDDDGGDFGEKYPYTSLAYSSMGDLVTADQLSFLKANMSAIGSATARDFEEKFKKLREEETEILLRKFHVFSDHTKRVLDGIRMK